MFRSIKSWLDGLATKKQIEELKKIMAKTAQELADEIKASAAQTRKAIDEVKARIKALEDAVAGGDLAVIEAAVSDLKVATQAADDVIPDQAPNP